MGRWARARSRRRRRSGALAGQQLVFTPRAILEDGRLVWICGAAIATPGATPVIDDCAQYTSIMPK